MEGFKQCENGHFFKEELSECPYCPKSGSKPAGGAGSPNDKTQFSAGDKTQFMSGDKTAEYNVGSFGDKTRVASSPSASPRPNTPPARDLSKTFIQEVETVDEGEGKGSKEVVRQRSTRRIVGWLISYTLDPMGIDYRIYEGNNSIGRTAENDITVAADSSISSRHATILFKKGRFFVRDEMAANGTFINEEELDIGQPVEMKDGDDLKVGNTVFKFKSPL